jgi:cell division protein FtsW (lipid II flippase)
MKGKHVIRPALVTALLLLVPLAAMQFTDEVDWNWFDFAVMGALIFATCLAYELAARKSGAFAYRAAAKGESNG